MTYRAKCNGRRVSRVVRLVNRRMYERTIQKIVSTMIHRIRIKITAGGALGTATFNTSLDKTDGR